MWPACHVATAEAKKDRHCDGRGFLADISLGQHGGNAVRQGEAAEVRSRRSYRVATAGVQIDDVPRNAIPVDAADRMNFCLSILALHSRLVAGFDRHGRPGNPQSLAERLFQQCVSGRSHRALGCVTSATVVIRARRAPHQIGRFGENLTFAQVTVSWVMAWTSSANCFADS